MSIISRVTTWADNQVLTASALNGEFNNIINDYNGGITNANISSSAAIATSKINATFPSGAIVGTTDSQTLTNKTLTTPTLNNPTVNGSTGAIATYTPAGAGTATLDLSAAQTNFVTMPAGNVTIALSNATAAKWFVVRILQDSSGSRTVTWFTTIKWAGGSPPTLTTTANKADSFLFLVTSTGNYDGFIVGQNL